MARAIFQNIGGGGGGSSEDCTATKNKVLEGYTAITSDSNDEPVAGTMKDQNKVDSSIGGINNTYPNVAVHMGNWPQLSQTTVSNQKLLCMYPPNGYWNGAYVGMTQKNAADLCGLTASKLLAGQTAFEITGTATSDATATANYIYTGKTAYKNGQKITGTMTVNSILSFDYAAYSTTQIIVKWQNPSKGPFSGVVICAKTGGYPTSPDDNRKYTGYGDNKNANAWSSTIIGGLTSGTTYYFRIWWYATCSAGDMFSSTAKQFTCNTTASGRKSFTSSGTWTVPTGVKTIKIHCTGGGASGGCGDKASNSSLTSGGGGGGGYCSYKTNISVTPGESLNIIVGTGGIHKNSGGCVAGNLSSVSRGSTTLCTANGGSSSASSRYGSNGGSGGGAGAKLYYADVIAAGNGGSNGANGGGTDSNYTGKGQGTATREFGVSSGTLYSGGGGGGAARNWVSGSDTEYNSPSGSGGSGGGAAGGSYAGVGSNGTAGTGGGGGGGGADFVANGKVGGNGGSGCVIIAW